MTVDPGQDRDAHVASRGKSLQRTKKRSSTGHFVMFRTEVDELARQVADGELAVGDAVTKYDVARNGLVEQLDAVFMARVHTLAMLQHPGEAPPATDPPSAVPG